MSLRGRLLVVLILLNVAVVGVLQVASWTLQRSWLDRHQDARQGFFAAELRDLSIPLLRGTQARARALLRGNRFSDLFRDVLVVLRSDNAGTGRHLLNPVGAAQRGPGEFPREAILAGIDEAMASRTVVPTKIGFCLPLLDGDDVTGGAWYEPRVPSLPALPSWAYAVPVIVSALLFGVLAFWSIGRAMARPFQLLGAAALQVGRGERGVRVPQLPGAPELAPLVDEFNAMAQKVESHTDELAREVQRATEEAQRKERALLVSSRLAAMGTLAAGIAHEINNPIGGMMNAVQRLLQRDNLQERERQYLELVAEGLERVRGIARKVLDFSPRQIQPMPFAVAEALRAAHALVEHRMRNDNVELRLDMPADLPRISGDRHEIQQVFLNVFLNSLDVLAGSPNPRVVAVKARLAGDQVEIEIADNGPGCGKDTLARVLDPFFSDKGRPDATGLGLFICYSIVKNHGGELEVESEPGRGFLVRIRLPASTSTT